MWIFFSLMFPLLFAAVYVIDSYCVGSIYEKSWLGIIIGAIFSTVVFLPLPFLLPFISFEGLTWQLIGGGILAGIIIQITQALYFEAIEHSDAGVISAYLNMIPAFVFISSILFVGESLTLNEYLGIFILLISSVFLSLLDSTLNTKFHSFVLMFIAAWLQVIAILLIDWVFKYLDFYLGFLLISTGIIIGGLFPLLFFDIRNAFIKNYQIIYNKRKLFLYIEILNLIAYGCFEMALKLGKLALVTIMETITPIFVLIFAMLIARFSKIKIKETTYKFLPTKIFIITLMCLGVWLIT